jgi:amidohydrolase
MRKILLAVALTFVGAFAFSQKKGQTPDLKPQIDALAAKYQEQLISWRRHIHANPELSNREVQTAAYILEALKPLGLEIKSGIAHHGIRAILRGGKPGPVVALRADMDALPVTEVVDVPFASKAVGEYNGAKVGVMHACGHDTHVAMLLATAYVLNDMKAELPGTVMFIFQPAEEGAPAEEGKAGAELMLREGLFNDIKPNAVFGLHVFAGLPTGTLSYRSGPFLAAADRFQISIYGKQTHGAKPWAGNDPIVVASQVIMGIQTIASRQLEVTKEPSIITVGKISGGVRNNIIPDSVQLLGTIRTFNEAMRADIHSRLIRTAQNIAEASGARAEVYIERQYPVTDNHPPLSNWSDGILRNMATSQKVVMPDKETGAEDFSFFQQQVPGFYFKLGVTPPADLEAGKAVAINHSPSFYVDEAALIVGVRAMANLTVSFLQQNPPLSATKP